MINTRIARSKLLKCRCSATNRDYIVRIDRVNNSDTWQLAYSFPMDHSMEPSANETVSERMTILYSSNYKGCPCCGNKATNFCSCGGIFCSSGDGTGMRTCPVCGITDNYGFNDSTFEVESFNS